MSKLGISIRIDVTKLDKERFYKGDKGTYADLTTFVDVDNVDKYDNNGFVTQSQTKEEREAGEKLPILGNSRVFYNDSKQAPQKGHEKATIGQRKSGVDYNDQIDDDLPF